MPIQLINVGTVANDLTGDLNRVAWQKANSMFTELYEGLEDTVSQIDFDAEMADVNSAIAGLAAVVAGKANAADVAYKVNVALNNEAQAHTNVQRRQMIANGGHSVTLPFELVPDNEILDALDIQQILPRFPKLFTLLDVHASAHLAETANADDYDLTLNLKALGLDGVTETVVASGVSLGIAANGTVAIPVLSADNIIPIQRLTVRATVVRPNSYGTAMSGLTLWLRGVWAA